jgi:hypothetical protein
MLKSLAKAAPVLYASVPNESVFPWKQYDRHGDAVTIEFHFRHYTKREFQDLLAECGWRINAWFGQSGAESDVEPGLVGGRTLIAKAERSFSEDIESLKVEMPKAGHWPLTLPVPDHVAILGLGPSVHQYLNIVRRLGSRRSFSDEVWAINALGDVVQCDRIFHMDDVRIQQIRADAAPDSNIAKMLGWIKTHPGPIYTSRAHPDYPGLVEFPLQDVLNHLGYGYFNSTAAYAVAYAIHIGVKKITCMGMDFSYENSHTAEKGRGCVEFWLGQATARGIQISMPRTSTLMDALEGQKFYGYDTLDVRLAHEANGHVRVSFDEKAVLPTAEAMETLYDHQAHPNAIVRAEQETA